MWRRFKYIERGAFGRQNYWWWQNVIKSRRKILLSHLNLLNPTQSWLLHTQFWHSDSASAREPGRATTRPKFLGSDCDAARCGKMSDHLSYRNFPSAITVTPPRIDFLSSKQGIGRRLASGFKNPIHCHRLNKPGCLTLGWPRRFWLLVKPLTSGDLTMPTNWP